jgi:hypothetical protein
VTLSTPLQAREKQNQVSNFVYIILYLDLSQRKIMGKRRWIEPFTCPISLSLCKYFIVSGHNAITLFIQRFSYHQRNLSYENQCVRYCWFTRPINLIMVGVETSGGKNVTNCPGKQSLWQVTFYDLLLCILSTATWNEL